MPPKKEAPKQEKKTSDKSSETEILKASLLRAENEILILKRELGKYSSITLIHQ